MNEWSTVVLKNYRYHRISGRLFACPPNGHAATKAETVPVPCQLSGATAWQLAILRLLHVLYVSKAGKCQQLEPAQSVEPRPEAWLMACIKSVQHNRYDSQSGFLSLQPSLRFHLHDSDAGCMKGAQHVSSILLQSNIYACLCSVNLNVQIWEPCWIMGKW